MSYASDDREKATVSTYIPRSVKDRLIEIARKAKRSVSSIAAEILEEYVLNTASEDSK